jgi:hypothetical protein
MSGKKYKEPCRSQRDVFIRILSEVGDKPESYVAANLETFEKAWPGALRESFYKKIPPEEAEKLLNQFREEKEGIRQWLIEGAVRARLRLSSILN